MNESMRLYYDLANGVAVISTLVHLFGLSIGLANRRLSRKMWLVIGGFGGLFVASIINRGAAYLPTAYQNWTFVGYLVGSLLYLAALLLLVFGLGAVFTDLRRRLALAQDRSHGRP